MKESLKNLVGKKIVGIATPVKDIGIVYGLILDDDSVVWVLKDADGNGPGYIEYERTI